MNHGDSSNQTEHSSAVSITKKKIVIPKSAPLLAAKRRMNFFILASQFNSRVDHSVNQVGDQVEQNDHGGGHEKDTEQQLIVTLH